MTAQETHERLLALIDEIGGRLIAYEALRPMKIKSQGFADMQQVYRDAERETIELLTKFFNDDSHMLEGGQTGGVDRKGTKVSDGTNLPTVQAGTADVSARRLGVLPDGGGA